MNIIETIRTARAKRRSYNTIVHEIESLSERDAADIGISRYDAHRIATKTVYG